MKNKLYVSALTVCIAVFIFSAAMICKHFINQVKTEQEFDNLEELIVTQDDNGKKVNPPEGEPLPKTSPYERYSRLYQENNDFIGWITIEGTNVNYPVMQKKDSVNYYLKRDFNKDKSSHGVPYIDEKCDAGISDNIIIYGHHMKDGTMFSDVCDYKKKSFWEKHKIIKFDTLEEYGKYEVAAAFKISADENFPLPIDFADEESFNSFIEICKKRSLYDTGMTPQYGDKLITLYTCEYSQRNGRMIVVGVKSGE